MTTSTGESRATKRGDRSLKTEKEPRARGQAITPKERKAVYSKLAEGMSQTEVARQTGISVRSVWQLAKDAQDEKQDIATFNEALPDILGQVQASALRVQLKALDSITDQHLKDATVNEICNLAKTAGLSAAVAIDKARLILGKSTANNLLLVVQQRADERILNE